MRYEYRVFGIFSGLGFFMVGIILGFMYLGIYLDEKLGTGFVFALLLTLLGMFLGGWWTYYTVTKFLKKEEKRN